MLKTLGSFMLIVIERLNAAGTIRAMHARVITLELPCAVVELNSCSNCPSLRIVIPPASIHDPNTNKIFENMDPNKDD